ncbi:MAG: aconitase X catalytic domain-containing protein [Acidobacteriota bacterium]|jgi:predicted aconitase
MHLSDFDRACLAGEHGPASQFAMSILMRMGEIQGAREMIDITRAHIDSTLYQGDATLEFAERLAKMGARVAVPTTLNVSGVDEMGWQEWAVPPEHAEKAHRQMLAYQSMGTEPTWTCAPYQVATRPSFGEQIAWGESNAVCFANSVLGARTIQYPDLLDICAAVTGRVPAVGLHLDENRLGQVLLELVDIPDDLQHDDSFPPVLGHLLGTLADDRVPVIDGLTVELTEDQLKALCAGSASSGSVNLFHIVGQTPEAGTREEAFGGKAPLQAHRVGLRELREVRDQLDTSSGEALDMVVLGSPHFSLAEFRRLAPLLAGKKRDPGVQFLVTTSRAMLALARDNELIAPLEAFGGKVTVDTCILTTPMLFPETRRLMTNSAKYAYYSPGLLDVEVAFGSMADCVRSAVEGHVLTDDALWRD